jgi:hypothetical protein
MVDTASERLFCAFSIVPRISFIFWIDEFTWDVLVPRLSLTFE